MASLFHSPVHTHYHGSRQPQRVRPSYRPRRSSLESQHSTETIFYLVWQSSRIRPNRIHVVCAEAWDGTIFHGCVPSCSSKGMRKTKTSCRRLRVANVGKVIRMFLLLSRVSCHYSCRGLLLPQPICRFYNKQTRRGKSFISQVVKHRSLTFLFFVRSAYCGNSISIVAIAEPFCRTKIFYRRRKPTL
jgi:hypothetical protein